jgi:CubicO group peptidase (beta-lactamase class C family)
LNKRLELLLDDFATDALVVTQDGRPLIHYGHVDDIFNLASMRKSLLSALYGIRVANRTIDLSLTLEQLQVNDTTPQLTAAEKTATIQDLLKLRSGVYHVANYEGTTAKDERPLRGSHAPGTFYYYNNWDANALGTIYRQLTHQDIFQDFKDLIADPIGMTRFKVSDCEYNPPDEDSIHPAYVFHMNSIDLEKFVQLYLRNGNWNGTQIVPSHWIEQSLTAYSRLPDGNGLGYFWEVAMGGKLYGVDVGEAAFAFSGGPGHYMVGIPAQNKTVVHALRYNVPGKATLPTERFAQLLELISQL